MHNDIIAKVIVVIDILKSQQDKQNSKSLFS